MGTISQIEFSKTDIALAIGVSVGQFKRALIRNGYQKADLDRRGSIYSDLEAFNMVKTVCKTLSDAEIMQIIHPKWHQNEGKKEANK